MRFRRENLLLDHDFIDFCFIQIKEHGSNFVHKGLDKVEVQASKESLIDLRSFVETLLNRNRFGGNFLASILDQYIKKIVDYEVFKKLIVNFFDEFTTSHPRIALNLEETRVIEYLGSLGLSFARERVIHANQIVQNYNAEHDLIENFYRALLNHFDGTVAQETSSFEQLKVEAIRQLSIGYGFADLVRPR